MSNKTQKLIAILLVTIILALVSLVYADSTLLLRPRPYEEKRDPLDTLLAGNLYFYQGTTPQSSGIVKLVRVLREEDTVEIRFAISSLAVSDQEFRQLPQPWKSFGRIMGYGNARQMLQSGRFVPYLDPVSGTVSTEAKRLIEEDSLRFMPAEYVPFAFGLETVMNRMATEAERNEPEGTYTRIYREVYSQIFGTVYFEKGKFDPWFEIKKTRLSVNGRHFLLRLFRRIYDLTGVDVVLIGVLDSYRREMEQRYDKVWYFRTSTGGKGRASLGRLTPFQKAMERQGAWPDLSSVPPYIDHYFRSKLLNGIKVFNTDTSTLITDEECEAIRGRHLLSLVPYYPKRDQRHATDPFSRNILLLRSRIRYSHDFSMVEQIRQIVRERLQTVVDQSLQDVDFILPAPSYYLMGNQCLPLAEIVGEIANRPVNATALVQIERRRKQRLLPDKVRRARNAGGLFKGDPVLLKDKSVVIVDDNMTTGFTAISMMEACLAAGARKVYVLSYGRTVSRDVLSDEIPTDYLDEEAKEERREESPVEMKQPPPYGLSHYVHKLFEQISDDDKTRLICEFGRNSSAIPIQDFRDLMPLFIDHIPNVSFQDAQAIALLVALKNIALEHNQRPEIMTPVDAENLGKRLFRRRLSYSAYSPLTLDKKPPSAERINLEVELLQVLGLLRHKPLIDHINSLITPERKKASLSAVPVAVLEILPEVLGQFQGEWREVLPILDSIVTHIGDLTRQRKEILLSSIKTMANLVENTRRSGQQVDNAWMQDFSNRIHDVVMAHCAVGNIYITREEQQDIDADLAKIAGTQQPQITDGLERELLACI